MRVLELEPRLKLNNAPFVRSLSLSELTGISNVSGRRRYSEVREVQNIECVERISSKYEFCLFPQHRHFGQEETLRQREIDVGVTGTKEDVATAASRAFSGDVEFAFRIWKNAINELLLRSTLDHSSKVCERIIGAGSVTVTVIISVTAANRCGKGIPAMVGRDCADSPATKNAAQEIVTPTEDRQLPHCSELEIVSNVKVGVPFVH